MDTQPAPRLRSARNYFGGPQTGWRLQLFTIIFEADTRSGRAFDVVLLASIVISVGVAVLDSVDTIHAKWAQPLHAIEWFFTVLFTVEYILRLSCVRFPLRYARSVLGIIDLLAIAPTWLSLIFPGIHLLINVRVLRMLRIFRILKMAAYLEEFRDLREALIRSRRKIAVFLSFVMMIVIVMGTLMYVVEGPEHGFTSVPVAVYWSITAMTTVGFGDIAPQTDLGRLIASVMMLMGWGTLAVPTGIVSAEFATHQVVALPTTTRSCPSCLSIGHIPSAKFCRDCGAELLRYQSDGAH